MCETTKLFFREQVGFIEDLGQKMQSCLLLSWLLNEKKNWSWKWKSIKKLNSPSSLLKNKDNYIKIIGIL